MKLEVGERVQSRAPDDAAIASAIRSLQQQAEDEAFAILSRDELTYIQTVPAADGLFGLEYQAGGVDAHYVCYEDLDEAQIIRVFTLYLHDDERWRTEHTWEAEPSIKSTPDH